LEFDPSASVPRSLRQSLKSSGPLGQQSSIKEEKRQRKRDGELDFRGS